MTNIVQLLLTPEDADGPALLMKHLGQRYVKYVNRTYKRSGTLWGGRFRSCLTWSEKPEHRKKEEKEQEEPESMPLQRTSKILLQQASVTACP